MAEFRLLGAVEVWVGDRLVDAGQPRQRGVLAALLVDAGQLVTWDALVDRVWGDTPPNGSRQALYSHVARIRRVLASAATPGQGLATVQRQAGGYVLDVARDQVDVHRFRKLVDQARDPIHDATKRVAGLREALSLWRGDPLAGLSGRWAARTRETWRQQYVDAVVAWAHAELHVDNPAVVITTVTELLGEHPLAEPLTAVLIRALAAAGRPAEALDCYTALRHRLIEALGVDPNAELQQLHQQILTNDPTIITESTVDSSRSPVPRQLPAPPRLFTGRGRELAALSKMLEAHGNAGATVVISAIGGTGGIGKTWLALHWAHHNLDRFPDGQLHVNLRGFDPTAEPMPATVAVRGFLDTLGVEPAAIPRDPDAQAALYRSLIADKRILIVVDNARDTAHVTPLLPGSPTCTVLVTSRNQLTGLITTHSARPLDLDVLTDREAQELLTAQLGHDRTSAEPDAVADLLDSCAGLPLALSIVAARAATHPHFPLAALADELRDTAVRLDALDAGDLSVNLRAVFSCSYHTLHPDTAAMFGLLGLAPGPDIGLPAVASLTAQPLSRTRTLLRDLERAHLVHQHTPGRYRMHDLTRLYATEQATHDHSEPARTTALRRLLDFYTHTAHTTERLLEPHRQPIQLNPPAPGTLPHPLPDTAAALAWLDNEYPNLLAAHYTAITQAWHHTVWQLAWTLNTFHSWRGLRHDELAVWQAALDAAAHLPDPTIQTLTHRLLGHAYADLARHEEATRHLHQALALAEHHHDPAQQAYCHHALAWAWGRRRDDRRAVDHATHALHLFRTLDQPVWEARALNQMGWYAAHLGEYDTAREHCQASLTLYQHHHDPDGEADALDSLGYINHHTGHHHRAIDQYQQALTLLREIGNTYESANTLDALGHPHAALGRYDHARAAWRQALDLYRAQHRTDDVHRVQRQLATLDTPVGSSNQQSEAAPQTR